MDRVYQSNAVETPPEPVTSSGSYPTAGSKVTGQSATVPGPYWFYAVTEEIRNAIIAAGITPNQNEVDQLAKALGKTVPVGAVIAMAGNSPVSGYLLCNGAEVSRTTYATLFAAIGVTYGSGDGSTTFNLPNLTDRFIQGSGTAGTVKSAGLPNITGTAKYFRSENGYEHEYTGAFYAADKKGKPDEAKDTSATYNDMFGFDASRSNSIYGNSTTVQPPALTMRYYIKY